MGPQPSYKWTYGIPINGLLNTQGVMFTPTYIYIYTRGVIGDPTFFHWFFRGPTALLSNHAGLRKTDRSPLRTIPLGSARMSMEQLNKLITELIEVWLGVSGLLAHVVRFFRENVPNNLVDLFG